jgi:hypothetical protein
VLLEDLGFPQTQATTIHDDRKGCIALSKGTVLHLCAKHIEIHHHFIHERIKNSEVKLKYCPTKDQLADIFTKQLPCEAFEKLRTTIGVGEYQ